jgi:DNA polymerase-3 subunit alpha
MALCVVVTAIKRQLSKRSGAEYARLTIEDFSGSTEVMVFPEKWSTLAEFMKTDVPVLMRGAYGRRDQDADNPSFVVDSVQKLTELRANGQVMISLFLKKDPLRMPDTMRELRSIVEAYPGTVPLEVEYSDGNGLRATLRSRSLTLAVNSTALGELRSLLGDDSVRLQRGSR